ncbi:MAG TPA: 50S ribosomal protein L10 [Gaiellaceae bacterium]|nr:50S ribosomal protein L10 [Gaiellaceae bacterium]
MLRSDKEQVVAELTEQLRTTESLIVADYRGLTNSDLESLRGRLREHGARFTVVKNTLTRRAAEAAGADALLALLEGPSAIAFVEAGGDPVAVAKALSDTARDTKVLALRGGLLEGVAISGDQVESLAKLPPQDVLRSQLVGVIVAPLTQLLGLLSAPLRDLVGLIDARIAQLEEQGAVVELPAAVEEAAPEPAEEEPAGEPTASVETVAEADVETGETEEDSNETKEEE